MLEKYKTVYEGGEGEIVEKKSRFIATVRPIQTEEEALAFIEEMKKKYWDARHNCYVYSVGKNREYTRCSDDGEPSGTAGRPMLDVILGEDIYNVAAVVTRYFGGILLGTGGLVRAYSRSLQEGLAASTVIEKTYGISMEVVTDYTGIGKIQYIADRCGAGGGPAAADGGRGGGRPARRVRPGTAVGGGEPAYPAGPGGGLFVAGHRPGQPGILCLRRAQGALLLFLAADPGGPDGGLSGG